MLDVTYIFSSYANSTYKNKRNANAYPCTTRIMTKILNNQKDLNVEYSNIPLLAYVSFLEYSYKTLKTNFEEYHKIFIKNLDYKIMTEYVLLTLGNPYEVLFAIELLNKGKKVVVGGPFTKLFSLKIIREIFLYNGATNLDNLLIVRPYINETIDLFKVIKTWKDIDIDVKFDTSDLYIGADEDFYSDFVPILNSHGISFDQLAVFFSTNCNWKKCTFCRYASTKVTKNGFFRPDNIEKSLDSCIKVADEYGLTNLAVSDPEFYFTKNNLKMIEYLRKHNKQISFFTSVRLLKSKKYFKRIRENSDVIHALFIGTESLDDFALKLMNKGNTYQDNVEVMQKIIDHNYAAPFQNHIRVLHLLMQNLATKNSKHVLLNYLRLNEMKKMLEDSNTIFTLSTSQFNNTPLIKYTTNNPYLKLKDHPYKINNEHIRIDENGKIMPSDLEIVGEDLYDNIVNTIRW